MNRTYRNRLVFCLAAIALTTVASARDYAINWYTVDGGGGVSSGGQYRVAGTIGQPDAGRLAGGSFAINGGFWQPAVTCAEDLNGDGVINLTDLATLLSNFGTASGATPAQGDINGDGAVNLTDLATLLAVFGSAC